MTVTFRPVRSADKPELARMLGEMIDYLDDLAPGAFPEKPDAAALEATAGLSFAADPVCATLIAEDGGKAVGYLGYYFGVWEVYPTLYVAGLYVRASHRGKGVGRALMEEARRLAAMRGASHVAWFVWRKNAPAQAFYRGLGAEFADEDVLMTMTVAGPR